MYEIQGHKMLIRRRIQILALAALGAFAVSGLVGCAKPIEEAPTAATIKKAKPFDAGSDSGVPVGYDNKSIFVEADAKHFVARNDPFALNPSQLAFEKAQEKERVLQDLGGFYEAVPPPEQEEIVPVIEPQPYRRLAGVVVAQSVIGIIELNGNQQQLIRPGQLIPGTEWRVVSIDTDKAVLRRGGNVLPHEIIVRLESRPFGTGPGPGGGNPTGGPGQGGPGAPPPGGFGPGRGGNGGAGGD
jgi:hypothetical protein